MPTMGIIIINVKYSKFLYEEYIKRKHIERIVY